MSKTLTVYSVFDSNSDEPHYWPTKKQALSSAHAHAELEPDDWEDGTVDLEGHRMAAKHLGGDDWHLTFHRYKNTTSVERCVVAVGGRKDTCNLLNRYQFSYSSEVIVYVAYDLYLAKTVELTPAEVDERGLDRL